MRLRLKGGGGLQARDTIKDDQHPLPDSDEECGRGGGKCLGESTEYMPLTSTSYYRALEKLRVWFGPYWGYQIDVLPQSLGDTGNSDAVQGR